MGDAFLLNRYLMEGQFECKRDGDDSAVATNLQQQAAYDINANEFQHPNAELIYGSRKYSVKGDCHHTARIYYDMPLCLSSFENERTTVSLPQMEYPVSFTRKTDIDSPSRSSHAKLPNCLRRKQLSVYKTKYVESNLDAKLTAVYKTTKPNADMNFLPQNELLNGQKLYRPNMIGMGITTKFRI